MTSLNQEFHYKTKSFIRRHFMTAIGITPLSSEMRPFELHRYSVGGYEVVRVDAWDGKRGIPLSAFWVPQGLSCVVPVNPGCDSYVFTPDFSGCSIFVDQLCEREYRVYHVQGGSNYMEQEYSGNHHMHGLGLAGSLVFDDYGSNGRLARGFAFMKYEEGRWWIYYQGQNGYGLSFKNGKFTTLGPQTVHRCGRVPVANLMYEVPRGNALHSGRNLMLTRNIRSQTVMLPNDEVW